MIYSASLYGSGGREILRIFHLFAPAINISFCNNSYYQNKIAKNPCKGNSRQKRKIVSFAAELLGREDLAEPYRDTPFEAIGKKLRSYNSTDTGNIGDEETTDDWARELMFEGWYGWRGFDKSLIKFRLCQIIICFCST